MAIMQLTVLPMGISSCSVSDYVAEFHQALTRENIPFTMTDMSTIVEGECAELLSVAAKIHNLPFNKGVQRVVTQITIDERRDKEVALGDKLRSVKQKL